MPGAAYNVPGISPDVLAQLLGASWRGIGFPSLMFSLKGSHNVVTHKRVDRAGWYVENTGQNGNVHTLKIPFINTIQPGQNETWGSEPLYPTVYRRFLTALEDRTSGPFTHPDVGTRNCKATEWEITLDPDFRGGPTAVVTLFETVDDASNVASLASTSIMPIAVAAAQNLDAMFATLTPPPNTGTPYRLSLTDFLKSLGALADEWNLMKMQWAASIDRVTYQLGVLEEKFGDEPGFSDATERLISALHALKQKALRSASKPVKVFVVPARTTLAGLANRLGNTFSNLLQLNPTLAQIRIVPPNTAVVYYA